MPTVSRSEGTAETLRSKVWRGGWGVDAGWRLSHRPPREPRLPPLRARLKPPLRREPDQPEPAQGS
jgi:hypothetical protein